MSTTGQLCTDPLHIAISKSRGVHIDWKDGHKSEYPLEYLRDECPCASCTGAHGTEPQKSNYSAPEQPGNPFLMFKPKLKMLTVEEVGTYAFRASWNDGHSSGIYSFEYLRRICPCPECATLRREGRL
jgi:DUF971 family protein